MEDYTQVQVKKGSSAQIELEVKNPESIIT